MDWTAFAGGLAVGVYLGWGYHRLWRVMRHNLGFTPEPPQRQLRLVVNDYRPPYAPEPLEHVQAWRESIREYLFWGNLCGFAERAMLAEGVASRPIIRRYRRFLEGAGLLTVTERGGTTWRPPWNYPTARAFLKHGLLPLPFPEHSPWPLRRAWITAQMAQAGADGAGHHYSQ